MSDLKQKWLALNNSEQRMILYGLTLIILSLCYFYVWKPYQEQINHYRQQTRYVQEDIVWLEQMGRQIKQLKSGTSSSRGDFSGSFIEIVDKSIKQNRLSKFVGVLENSGSDKVVVQFNKVSFNTLINWVGYIKKRYGILVKNMDARREGDSDKVYARIILKKN